MRLIILFILLTITSKIFAKENEFDEARMKALIEAYLNEQKPKQWFQNMKISGYTQFRYNRFLESNKNLKCPQCDRSIGDGNNFFLRRGRIIFQGERDDRVFFYIQPDFVSQATDTNGHFFQVRDAYFDVALDAKKEHRFRLGQSKVPFSFENLQSSSRRLALDRNDALNSAAANERDLGFYYMWANAETRKLFQELLRNNLKGSGDYGIFALGVHNGQTANKNEENNNVHVVSRLALPFYITKDQIIEPHIQAYSGMYHTGGRDYKDERAAVGLTVYPMPIGLQAEYNVGVGPEYQLETQDIQERGLRGGYIQLNFLHQVQNAYYIPFIKFQHYDGGKKHEKGASYRMRELEVGVEWQPIPSFEVVSLMTFEDRFVVTDKGENQQRGHRLRIQLQVNY